MPPLNLYARVRFFLCTLHTRPRVQRAPGIPCPLLFARVNLSKLGRIAPREREGMSFMKHNARGESGRLFPIQEYFGMDPIKMKIA
jgi:hypothetical protein